MSYRLAIFDFDGTLADSWPFFMSVFNEIADQHGFRRVDAAQAEQLRLQEARRLMLAGSTDAASAGHAVGYESSSQFSREYARFFGLSPGRDATRLRQSLQAGGLQAMR